MGKSKTTAIALLLAFTTTLAAPAAPAYAFSLTDLTSQTSTSSSSGGNGFMNILLGLLLGKMFSNTTGSSATAEPVNPVDTISKALGLTGISKNSPVNEPNSATASAVITSAKQYMGVPYVWGGSTPSGFDCSGFTQYVMKQNGITIPRTAAEQFATGTAVDKSALKIGDLVFFTTYKAGASHVGFYMGNGQFIHASSAGSKVTISSLDEKYYTEKYIGARRYISN